MRVLAFLLIVALLLGGSVAYRLYVPYGPPAETFVEITPGMRTPAMAQALENAGVIRSRRGFELLRLVRGGKLKAGEYRFDHPENLFGVYDTIARGEVYTIALKVPEGYNIYDIAQAAEMAKLGTKAGFLAAAHEQVQLIADLSPNAKSLEGFLFPDTYHFSRHATETQMVAAMVRRFRQVAAQLHLVTQVRETVTMASIVEKETGVDTERPLIAGVFVNRMQKGIPLATDPTVIYAALLEDRYRGTIYASDLQSDSPYNTYRHVGLPPGPISNPGVAALKAALAPTRTTYLYFVSDAQGHSKFSATLLEHNQNVQEYRHATESQKQP